MNLSLNFVDENIQSNNTTTYFYVNKNAMKSNQKNKLDEYFTKPEISDYLYKQYPGHDEGRLTKLRSSLVCEYTLAICARDVGLGQFLLLSKGEDMTGGRERDSILSDAFEALIGAIYLDGGMENAAAFIQKNLLKDVEDKTLFYDAKTILQEMVQSKGKGLLKYVLVKETGPDHNKEFTVETKIGEKVYARGIGKTKKGAEQIAAYQTILQLKNQ